MTRGRMTLSNENKLPDPYDPKPSFVQLHATPLTAIAVALTTVLLTVLSFPPFRCPEFAFAFAVPALFWAYRRPSFRLFAFTVLGSNVVAWIIILGWLHHVSWVGTVLLGALTGLWIGVWYLAAWWLLPKLPGRHALERILCIFGLAGLWVLIEWTRTWFLSGFPWLPLAASQWQRTSMLQIAAFTGSGGVSFVLISMNAAFTAYAHRLLCEKRKGLQRRSQEFFACLFLLVVCVTIHVNESFNRGRFSVSLGRVAFVQPYIPQSLKWDAVKAQEVLATVEKATLAAGKGRPDLILLPESVTPSELKGDPVMQTWAENLSKRAKAPIILGTMAVENRGAKNEAWYNAAMLLTPDHGLEPSYYAKRKLVPFGEFVPFRPVLGWLDKVVPVGDDFNPGKDPQPLLVNMRGHSVAFGPLICYEDIFSKLALSSARSGADVLVVLTNDAWYGESPAAMQHAAHSVLRAVETRRPVLRCGNHGLSAWIDEFGNVRAMIADEDGKIFVRRNGSVEITRDFRWVGKQSFYAEHGDWFVLVSLALAGFAYLLVRKAQPYTPPVEASDEGFGTDRT